MLKYKTYIEYKKEYRSDKSKLISVAELGHKQLSSHYQTAGIEQ